MPEYRESMASGAYLREVFEANPNSDWRLASLWYDATGEEVKAMKALGDAHPRHDKRQCQDLVSILGPQSKAQRGQLRGQTPIWPPQLQTTDELSGLVLCGIKATSRTVLMNFGKLWMQFQYLTHTSTQFYSFRTWETSICNVPRDLRVFRIGVAFVFQDFVISFNTRDNLFQMRWGFSDEKVPYQFVDILESYHSVLGLLVGWIKENRKNYRAARRQRIVIDAIREMRDVFFGVGVYTSSEIAFLAGLPPWLTEADVFDCPSRCARLCEAFYCFAWTSVYCVWPELVVPCIRRGNGILAPTIEERKQYSKYLFVYGKKMVRTSSRTVELIERMNTCNDVSSPEFCDAFEPSYLKTTLLEEGHLGHLIFGAERWQAIFPDQPPVPVDDPLTAYYRAEGLLASPTYLCATLYIAGDLFLDGPAMAKRYPRTELYLTKKQIWSVIPSTVVPEGTPLKPQKGSAYEEKLFSYIVQHTKDVAIGPLEYCGNGVSIKLLDGVSRRVIACQGDPDPAAVPVFYVEREIRSVERRTLSLDGQRKGTVSKAVKTRQVKKITASAHLRRSVARGDHASSSTSSSDADRSSDTEAAVTHLLSAAKKRKSADAAVVLQTAVRIASPVKRARLERGIMTDRRRHPNDDDLFL